MENEWQPAILLSVEQMICQYHKPFIDCLKSPHKEKRAELVGKKLSIRKTQDEVIYDSGTIPKNECQAVEVLIEDDLGELICVAFSCEFFTD